MYLAEVGQLDVNASTQASAQVRRTGEDVAQALVPHELPALLHDQPLHLLEPHRSLSLGIR